MKEEVYALFKPAGMTATHFESRGHVEGGSYWCVKDGKVHSVTAWEALARPVGSQYEGGGLCHMKEEVWHHMKEGVYAI